MPDVDKRPATLADLMAHGFDVCAYCLECQRAANVSARDLAARLGERFPIPALAGRMACSRCGSRNVTVRLADLAPPFSPAWAARKG